MNDSNLKERLKDVPLATFIGWGVSAFTAYRWHRGERNPQKRFFPLLAAYWRIPVEEVHAVFAQKSRKNGDERR